MSFPQAEYEGQLHTIGNTEWRWDGEKWLIEGSGTTIKDVYTDEVGLVKDAQFIQDLYVKVLETIGAPVLSDQEDVNIAFTEIIDSLKKDVNTDEVGLAKDAQFVQDLYVKVLETISAPVLSDQEDVNIAFTEIIENLKVGGSSSIISELPPGTPDAYGNINGELPEKGDLWIHEETMNLYVYDGDQWVQTHDSCDGGGGGADLQPILDTINPFVNYEPSNITGDDIRIYYSSGSYYNIRPNTTYNVIGTYQQTAEIDVNGDGNWEDIANINSNNLRTYSLTKGSSGGNNYLIGAPTEHGGDASDPSTWPNPSYPNILIRYWTENIVNDRSVKVYTDEISPYIPTHSYP